MSMLWSCATRTPTPTATEAGERHYVTHDANFNITALTDSSGAVVERYLYDPYGRQTVLDANWTPDADNTTDHAFTHGHQGGQLDPDTALIHFRNRDYSPALGRWVQQDPLGYVDGTSLYAGFASSPAVYVDPDGEAVYIVMRQFNSDDPKTRTEHARKFKCCGRLAHGYIVITNDDNEVQRTSSWHPQHFKDKSIKTTISTPGRVWENHPADMNPINADLVYEEFLVTEDPGAQQRLEREIDSFINNSGAGYERGVSKRRGGTSDSIGTDEHRPARKGAMTYELLGDNCVSWSVLMLDRAGLKPPPGVDDFNFGVFNRPGSQKPHLQGMGPKAHLR